MFNKDCNLHENQRKAGTLCRSMNCSKCPPYREAVASQPVFEPDHLDRKARTRIDFMGDLAKIINKHSIENEWDMPDFLMAEFITDMIFTGSKVMKKNLDWHGTDSVCHPKVRDERK